MYTRFRQLQQPAARGVMAQCTDGLGKHLPVAAVFQKSALLERREVLGKFEGRVKSVNLVLPELFWVCVTSGKVNVEITYNVLLDALLFPWSSRCRSYIATIFATYAHAAWLIAHAAYFILLGSRTSAAVLIRRKKTLSRRESARCFEKQARLRAKLVKPKRPFRQPCRGASIQRGSLLVLGAPAWSASLAILPGGAKPQKGSTFDCAGRRPPH